MPRHKVGTQEEWSAARKALLEREQELGNLDEELANQRQELPWVPVEKRQRRRRRRLLVGSAGGWEGRSEYYANQGELCKAVFDGPPLPVASAETRTTWESRDSCRRPVGR